MAITGSARQLPASPSAKRVFIGETPFVASWAPRILSVLRIIAGFLFVQHGAQKLFNYPIPSPMPVAQGSIVWYGGIIELVAGVLLIVGLFTRPIAFIAAGEMAVAYFTQHAPHGFWPIVNKGELAVAYCFMFLYFAVVGGGSWSIDVLFRRDEPLEAPPP
jgi:putative oxidoreductase